MKRGVWLAGAALALSSSVALARPESLLPDIFANPTPSPTPAPAPSSGPAPATRAATPTPSTGSYVPPFYDDSGEVVQPLPESGGYSGGRIVLPEDFPSIAEIEKMSADELDELFGLKPEYDIPPAARRAVKGVGLLAHSEGGLPRGGVAKQPVGLVSAVIEGIRGPIVSRWGHILVRRTLASRLTTPEGMDPVDFAAMRAALLLRMGEPEVARAMVQDVDSANYNPALGETAFAAYLATGDVTGICPVARLQPELLDNPEWQMARSICRAFAGDAATGGREIDRAIRNGLAPEIDLRLAQRYAGAAGDGRRAVNIEWDGVEELNRWRWALATALGAEVPENLLQSASPAMQRWTALSPAASLPRRAGVADQAAREGILSSAAMVDLYSQIYSEIGTGGETGERARLLREAYVAASPAERLAAIKTLWGEDRDYGRQVLTAYAAARMPVSAELAADAGPLVASMLAAGLDRNALRWAQVASEGSDAWAMLVLAQPERGTPVSRGAVSSYAGEASGRKAGFLLAGLAGLGRMDSGDVTGLAGEFGADLNRQTKWSRLIDRAAELNNPVLVSLLAGVGMQGQGWDKMTARHLFHIVRSLDRVGLSAEARMIAAEAVARG